MERRPEMADYWYRWIGDWKRKTSHLSAEKKGVYAELLDHYYATEVPLPLEFAELCRLAGAQSESELASVKYIIATFFSETPSGYINKKAQEQLAKMQDRREKNSANARTRWARPNGSPHHAVEQAASTVLKRNCAYCSNPSTSRTGGYEHCRDHFQWALEGKKP